MLKQLIKPRIVSGRLSLPRNTSRLVSIPLVTQRIASRHYNLTATLSQESKKNDLLRKSTPIGKIQGDKPMMMVAFTCKVCGTRSGHQMSKQAYTKGSVLVQCPGCKSRHLMADHLNIFQDKQKHVDVEELMRLQNENVSTNVNDLCFEDIPESLKTKIGHFAKDAPSEIREKLTDTARVHTLSPPSSSPPSKSSDSNKKD